MVLKRLGDGAIHPNDGDVDRQKALDGELIQAVAATFVELLDLVYEEPARRAARLATLEAAGAEVSKGPKSKEPKKKAPAASHH